MTTSPGLPDNKTPFGKEDPCHISSAILVASSVVNFTCPLLNLVTSFCMSSAA